jgi:hypothetical protein
MTRDALTQSTQPRGDADTGDVRIVAGRYALRRVLGRGGMGVVYEAENTWTNRRVALKVLDPERTVDPVQVERFMREARATSALRHRNVVDVLDMGQDPSDGALYIVQELLLGEDLKALLAREGRLDEGRARAVLAPLLKGLAAAHAAGIVHRDVKPANLFLTKGPDGEELPKVIDFGIARDMARDLARTGSGETIGTPAYMAPEQLRAERALTPAVDVWALGVVLHEMLAGATPFPSENYLVLVHRVLAGERPPLATSLAHVSPAMRALVERALDPDPAKRFNGAAAMLVALDADVADTRPAQRLAASPPRGRTLPVALAALAAAGLSLAAALYARAPATASGRRDGVPQRRHRQLYAERHRALRSAHGALPVDVPRGPLPHRREPHVPRGAGVRRVGLRARGGAHHQRARRRRRGARARRGRRSVCARRGRAVQRRRRQQLRRRGRRGLSPAELRARRRPQLRR